MCEGSAVSWKLLDVVFGQHIMFMQERRLDVIMLTSELSIKGREAGHLREILSSFHSWMSEFSASWEQILKSYMSSIVRSMLCPTIFRKIQRNFYDYQFHIRGDNRSAEGHIGSAGCSCDLNPGVLPPCPLSHAPDRAVCSDNVLPILEEHLVRSSFPVPILHCHKSAIRSFQGHDNH